MGDKQESCTGKGRGSGRESLEKMKSQFGSGLPLFVQSQGGIRSRILLLATCPTPSLVSALLTGAVSLLLAYGSCLLSTLQPDCLSISL